MIFYIQLFNFVFGINICLEYKKFVDKCFVEMVLEKVLKQCYKNVIVYVNVWKFLLNMEVVIGVILNDDVFIF